MYLVLPSFILLILSSISFKSIFLFLGSFISSTNGLPVPNILTSISSRPAPWNLASYPSVSIRTCSEINSSTDSEYCLPVPLHLSQPLPLHLVHGHLVCGIPRENLLYLPSIYNGLICILTMVSSGILRKSTIITTSGLLNSTSLFKFSSIVLPMILFNSFFINSTFKSKSSFICLSRSNIFLSSLVPTIKVLNSRFNLSIFLLTFFNILSASKYLKVLLQIKQSSASFKFNWFLMICPLVGLSCPSTISDTFRPRQLLQIFGLFSRSFSILVFMVSIFNQKKYMLVECVFFLFHELSHDSVHYSSTHSSFTYSFHCFFGVVVVF